MALYVNGMKYLYEMKANIKLRTELCSLADLQIV
jgi:hypothetical protein